MDNQSPTLPDIQPIEMSDTIRLFPALNFTALYDTDESTLDITGIEPSISLRTPYIEGFANLHVTYFDEEGDWDSENEEAFLKLVNLPYLPEGFALKGGKFLNRFGYRNNQHLHAWDWRELPLVNERFLGEENLSMEGGEASIQLPFLRDVTSFASVAFGSAVAHDHGHGEEDEDHHDDDDHGDDDHHDDDDEDHHDDEEEGHHDDGDEHGHGHDDDELFFSDDFITFSLHNRYMRDDFNQFDFGLSHGIGELEDGDDLNVTGAHFAYQWRENGLEPGGKSFRWSTELMLRNIDLEDGSESETGGYTQASYRFSPYAEAGLRFGYTEGIEAIETEETWRISPRLSIFPFQTRRLAIHTQFNHTEHEDDEEQTVLIGLNATFGGPEVR